MTNPAAIGYMILAAKKLYLDADTIRSLERMMYGLMDIKTEEEAEEAYQKN